MASQVDVNESVPTSGPSKTVFCALLLLACAVGAGLGWPIADRYYTPTKYRFIGGSNAKNEALLKELKPDSPLRQKILSNTFSIRALESGVAMMCGAMGALGLAGLVLGGFGPRKIGGIDGLIFGSALGAAVGLIAGTVGQGVSELFPPSQSATETERMIAVSIYQGSAYAIWGIGWAAFWTVFASGSVSFADAFARGILGAIVSTAGFVLIAPMVEPMADLTVFVPAGVYVRLLWLIVPAICCSLAMLLMPWSGSTDSNRDVLTRVESMDQFRGYTVTGMFAVNFLGGFAAIPYTLEHHNTHFSYADSIMPSFLFAVGFSYRLTTLKRLQTVGAYKTYTRVFRRAIALIFVSVMIFGLGFGRDEFKTWNELEAANYRHLITKLIKVDLWEVLSIIGVATVFTMPVIGKGFWVRSLYLLGCIFGHTFLTYWFNYDFVIGRANFMDPLWGTVGKSAFDGGPFGIISWSIPLLIGTLCYDVVANHSRAFASRRIFGVGLLLMALGYGMSCFTRAYDNPDGTLAKAEERHATSPVVVPKIALAGHDWKSLVAEPPFFPPPDPPARLFNFWMMSKRIPTLSFMIFASGFAMFVYSLFIVACDRGSLKVRLFNTFGQNPLAAYLIHELLMNALKPLAPGDSPGWWVMLLFGVFFALTLTAVRYLERENIFLRL